MQAVRTNGFLPQKPENCTTGMRGWRNWQTRTFEVRVVYPWGFESPPSHKRKAHGLAIDRGLFLCFPTKAANKTAGPDSIQGPAVLCMQEKGLEPSLTGNWCLKPARLPVPPPSHIYKIVAILDF